MKTITILILLISASVVKSQHNDPGHNSGSTVTCSSRKSHRKTCYADTSGGVQLIRQLSRATCNGNWGYTQNQIWVDHGCRAKFQLYVNGGQRHGNTGNNNVGHGNTNSSAGHSNNNYNNTAGHSNNNYNNNAGHGNQGYNNRIVCESINYNKNTCSIPQGARVSLSRQLSSASCDHNWGTSGGHVWVTNGCRAEFSINSNGH